MSLIHIATRCSGDWRSRLGDPEKHWKRGYSAMETAVSWENAAHAPNGLPQQIADLFQAGEMKDPTLLLAVAEHKVPLEGKGGDAQCDVWALVGTNAGVVSLSGKQRGGQAFNNG